MDERTDDLTDRFVKALDRLEVPRRETPAFSQTPPRRSWFPAIAAAAAVVVLALVLVPALAGRSTNVAGPERGIATSPSPTPSPTARAEQTKPPGLGTQPQLPLVTSVRWAVDRRSNGTLLVLLYEGHASSFRVIDANGATVLRVGIMGSGIFGPETCVVRARQPQELTTGVTVDPAALDSFMRQYRTYRVVAEGIPAGEVTLPLVDSGCRSGS